MWIEKKIMIENAFKMLTFQPKILNSIGGYI